MAKHIFQYCLLGILCIALVLASGPTPGLSECDFPTLCDTIAICDANCRKIGFHKGMCTQIGLVTTCCCM
ncbi:hypothetical protein MtrunA17_Chr3g0097971 [Medicago truncatula]|uniref:LCR-like protein n=1 Tax=Medicago truncatula TaxID=3880 RepID=A0A072UXL7_MEDTR|nr:LCR-like protein [Medicago truncatula]RHN67005.1 hypothetical protein MtrunA17_Chr3g0097971 [Medicago truncatula]